MRGFWPLVGWGVAGLLGGLMIALGFWCLAHGRVEVAFGWAAAGFCLGALGWAFMWWVMVLEGLRRPWSGGEPVRALLLALLLVAPPVGALCYWLMVGRARERQEGA